MLTFPLIFPFSVIPNKTPSFLGEFQTLLYIYIVILVYQSTSDIVLVDINIFINIYSNYSTSFIDTSKVTDHM